MAGRTKHSYIIRLQADGGRIVTAKLENMGATGEKSFQKIERSSAKAGATVGLLSRALKTIPIIAAAEAFRRMSRSVYDNIKTMEQIEFRLQRLTKGSEDFAATQEYLRSKAKELSIDLVTLTKSYSDLLALEDAGILNRAQVNEFAEGFANIKAALGVDDNRIGDVLYGLSQALSQGTVQAQELNQVIEPIPGFLNKIGEAAGVTAGEFREMVKSGSVSSEEFRDYVIGALKEYEGAAVEAGDTVTASYARMKNAWLELSVALGDAGVRSSVTGFYDLLADFNEGALNNILSLQRAYEDFANFFASFQSDADLGYTAVPIDKSGPSAVSVYEFRDKMINTMDGVTNRMDGARYELMSDGKIGKSKAPLPDVKPQEIYDRYFKAQERATKEDQRSTQAYRRQEEAKDAVVESLRFEVEQLQRSEKQQMLYNQLQSAGVEIDSRRGQEISKLVDVYHDISEAQKLAAEQTEHMNNLADEFGDAWGKTAEAVGTSFDNLGDAANQLSKDLHAMFYREFVSDPIRDFAGDIFKSFAGDLFGGFKAEGGPLDQGKWYIAGEYGPEPIWGGGPGAFAAGYPQSQPAGGQTNVNMSVNLIDQTNKGVNADVRQANGGRSIEIVLRDIVRKDIRGGAFDGAMQSRYGANPVPVSRG